MKHVNNLISTRVLNKPFNNLQERKLDWFPRLRTAALNTDDQDSSAFEIKKLSSLLEDTKYDLKVVCGDLKHLERQVCVLWQTCKYAT